MKKIKVIENSRFLSNEAMNEINGGGEILCPGRTDYLVCHGKFNPACADINVNYMSNCFMYGISIDPTPDACWKFK